METSTTRIPSNGLISSFISKPQNEAGLFNFQFPDKSGFTLRCNRLGRILLHIMFSGNQVQIAGKINRIIMVIKSKLTNVIEGGIKEASVPEQAIAAAPTPRL
jgi:hypothetical protein